LVWFDAELENLLAAHAWCSRVASAVERGLWLVGGLWNYWNPRGVLALGYRVTLEALERPGAQARTAARCLALTAAGYIGVHCGRAEQAQAHLQEGLGIAREINDKNRIAMALVRLALAEQTLGNRPAAGAHLEESLALARAAGIPHRIASALTSLGEWHRAVGEFDAAEPLYEEDLALAADNRPEGKLAPLLNLAMISIARSDADKARRRLQEILEVLERLPSRYAEIVTLEVCAALAAFLGQWERAEGFFAATEAQRERIGDHREPADDAFIAPWIERTRSALGGATSGAPITLEDALAQARVWIAGMNR
jgi:tetratricopeptide (TPR) repeat protein